MSEVRNGRQQIGLIAEQGGVARAVKGGQLVANQASMIAKLGRYIADPRKSDEDRAMYEAQLADVLKEGSLTDG